MEERLHKVLAAAGVASRREAEQLIAAGHVAVDGKTVTQMGVKVDPERQAITVDGRPVTLSHRRVYLLLNKPAGYVTTRADPHAARTVMDLVAELGVPVHPVGRLDRDTEGALILTNDGDLTQLLTHPRHAVPKIYQAHVQGVPGEKALERLRTGVRLEEGVTAPAQVRVLYTEAERSVLEITLREGRKRQVRRMLAAVGHPVTYLRRVAIGPVSVRKLPHAAGATSAPRRSAPSAAPLRAPPRARRSGSRAANPAGKAASRPASKLSHSSPPEAGAFRPAPEGRPRAPVPQASQGARPPRSNHPAAGLPPRHSRLVAGLPPRHSPRAAGSNRRLSRKRAVGKARPLGRVVPTRSPRAGRRTAARVALRLHASVGVSRTRRLPPTGRLAVRG